MQPAQLLGLARQDRRRSRRRRRERRALLAQQQRTSRLPTTSSAASTTSGILKLPVWSSAIPVNAGPTKPPRLPMAAISAMPAAAAVPLRKAVGQSPEHRKRREEAHGRERNADGEQQRRLRVRGEHRARGAHQRRPPRGRRRGGATISIAAVAKPYGIGGQHAHLEVGVAGPVLHEVGHEEGEPEAGRQQDEVDEAEQPDAPASRARHAGAARRAPPAARARAPPRPSRNARSSGSSQSASVGPLVEVAQRHEAERDRRDALRQEQPLPAVEPGEPVQLEQAAGQRAAGHVRRRHRGEEQRDRPRALALGEPPGEEQDDPREEAGLGRAQQEAQDVEARRVAR